MKLGFEERQSPYDSGSQSARFWTEKWVESSLYCPNCGNVKLDKFANNRPVADFLCTSCREEFELKSQKSKFGAKVVDGAYKTMRERIVASNNPNFLFMNYSLKSMGVIDLFIVPKHFFVPDILQQRKPLAETARRAGWIGCNILLNQIPESGKIFYVREGQLTNKKAVLAKWQETLFLRNQSIEAKGWLLEVMKCVDMIGKPEFDLEDVYRFEQRLSTIFPNNQNVKPKIRQQLQYLRDKGYLEFVSRGNYRLRPKA
ncbi:MAG: restriction endonuclease [Xanthobacteraceae bacterium]|nr:restriction endonuclease [Xanthobacteraceae bacterium]MCW5676684.1 restriction endonuclease [Xanthobacteraceae bacterium]